MNESLGSMEQCEEIDSLFLLLSKLLLSQPGELVLKGPQVMMV